MALRTAMAATIVAAAAGTAFAQGSVPFSETYRRPSVSPYTMLSNGAFNTTNGGLGVAGATNPLIYQQLVQPRVEQEQQFITQMQQGRQLNRLQSRVTEIQQGTTARQVNEQIRPTGHAATYQNLSHFYPMR
jgi:crotonobetainyl-CoA:carnitine CoA-transferase CaiB-like acyl-CoA transferase